MVSNDRELERSLGERRKFSDDRHQLRAQLLTVKGDGQRLQRTMEKLKSQNGTLEAVSHSLEEENERLRKQVRVGRDRISMLCCLCYEVSPGRLRGCCISTRVQLTVAKSLYIQVNNSAI